MKREDEANLAALAAIAQTQAEIDADAMESDADVPGRLKMLARRVNESTEQRVTAIKRGNYRRVEPATPIPDIEDRLKWHSARLSGKTVKPEAVLVNRDAWYFIIHGNPVMVESWLKDEGYDKAFADGPNRCMVMFA